jgi:hypothetical protein
MIERIPLTVVLLATAVGLSQIDVTVVRRVSATSCFQQAYTPGTRAEMRSGRGSQPCQYMHSRRTDRLERVECGLW